MDTNFWGLWCVPLGLLLGFTPVLIATVLTKPNDTADKDDV
jgi:hypothetical protein